MQSLNDNGPLAAPEKILLYYPPNQRYVAIETLCKEINKTGNKLIVLTQSPKGDFHQQLDNIGVETHSKVFSNRYSFFNYVRHFFYLISFCRKNRIDVLWSHLNPCNFVAVFAQYFIKARVVVFRHHFHRIIKEEGFSSVNRNERRVDRIISKFAREIVVPSAEVFNGMVIYEMVPPKKISIIPYIYDFSLYAKPDTETVKQIRTEFKAKLLIIIASRMLKMKRHTLVLPVFKKLIQEGCDIKILLLDDGEERNSLEQYVRSNELESKVFFLGLKSNITDYISAAGLLVHPSLTEASSSLVKEAGIMKKPVIVCSGVGDFDQYIVHMHNGFLVNPPNEAEEFEKYIKYVYDNPAISNKMGEALYIKVTEEFSPNKKTLDMYLSKT